MTRLAVAGVACCGGKSWQADKMRLCDTASARCDSIKEIRGDAFGYPGFKTATLFGWFALSNAWLLNEAAGLPIHWGFLLVLGLAIIPNLFLANSPKVPFPVWEWFVVIIGWATYLGTAAMVVILAWKFISR